MAMDFPAMVEAAASQAEVTHCIDMGPTEESIVSKLLAQGPQGFRLVSAVPTSARALAAVPLPGEGLDPSSVPLLARVAAVAAEVLGVAAEVSPDTPLVRLGMTSQGLGALRNRLLTKIPESAGRLPATAFYDAPTLRAIASLIGEHAAADGAAEAPALQVAPRSGSAAAAGVPPILHVSVYGTEGTTQPLSFGQEQMLRLQTMHPGCTAYNVSSSLWIAGGVNPKRLQSCIERVISRHDIFSSTVVTSPPSLRLTSVTPPVSILQVSDEAAALARMGEVGRTPFKLAEEASIRAEIAVLPKGLVLVILWTHHMNFDILSQGCFHRELHLLLSSPKPPAPPGPDPGTAAAAGLPELSVQYVDFSYWSRHCVSQGLIDAAPLLEELAPHAALALDLPLDKPRPKQFTFQADRVTTVLPFEFKAAHKGITPFVAHLTAFFIQLWKSSKQQSVMQGVPYHGRDHPCLEPLCGYFINMVCVVGQATLQTTALEALVQTRGSWQRALEHAAVPFLHVVDSLSKHHGVRFDPSRNPLFQVMLNYRAESTHLHSDPRFRVQPVHHVEGHVDFDVQVDRTGQKTIVTHNYCTDLFEPRTAERFAAQYIAALRALMLPGWKDVQTWRIPHLPRLLEDVTEAKPVSLEYSTRKLMPLLAELQRPLLVGGPEGLRALP